MRLALQEFFEGRKILVTGAAGFIGSNLVLQLLKTGARIVGLDNMNDHYDPCLKEYRLGLIEDAAKSSSGTWHFVRGDLADRELVNCVFHEEKPSVVVNLAAQAGGRYSITNPALKEKSLPENMPGGEERKRFG